MDLRYSESDEAFRAELRSWLEQTLPELPHRPSWDDWADAAARQAELQAGEQALLAEHGQTWSQPVRHLVTAPEFRRGFVDSVTMDVRLFLERSAERRRRLHRSGRQGEVGRREAHNPRVSTAVGVCLRSSPSLGRRSARPSSPDARRA